MLGQRITSPYTMRVVWRVVWYAEWSEWMIGVSVGIAGLRLKLGPFGVTFYRDRVPA